MTIVNKISRTVVLAAVVLLSACGGGETSAACAAPYQVKISRTANGIIQQTHKATVNSPEVLAVQGNGADVVILPCAGSGTQWFNFNVKTTNFFGGQGDHIAALTRGTFNMQVPQYIARGVILSPNYGLLGERMAQGYAPYHNICQNANTQFNGVHCNANMQRVVPLQFSDNVSYPVGMHSTPLHIAYSVAGYSQVWGESYDQTSLNGQNVALAVLCNGGCQDKVFSVTFSGISAGWF